MNIPLADLQVGAVLPFSDTIRIVSIDASEVGFTLSGTRQLFLSPGDADGSYVAPRCN